MKAVGSKLALQAALVLVCLGTAMPLHAEAIAGSILYICNKGTVPVEVVTAFRSDDIARGFGKYYWEIIGAIAAPQKCTYVQEPEGDPSYIAFGFTDSKGEWGSGSMAQVPDLGSIDSLLHQPEKVLTGATKAMCARRDANYYAIDDDFSTDCATLKLTGGLDTVHDRGHGPFLPLTSALYFHPGAQLCRNDANGFPAPCEWTHYYLNIFPSATDRELHAMRGTESGANATTAVQESGGSFAVLQAIAKAVADESRKEAKAKTDAAEAQLQHARDQEAAREQQYQQILAADAAGNPAAKVPAQIIRRAEEDNRQRWAGTPQSPAAYDPKWMGQKLVVVGTVSRVEVDPNGSPHWVSIYFKESPDATFVVCSPYPDLLQEKVGLDLNALVGKTLEAAGQVESPYCGQKNASKGSIRLVESAAWKVRQAENGERNAPPPPAVAPPSPPATSSDDDPVGSGGFITPPNPR